MKLDAHYGMLPLGAFEHCGDKRIKPQGGGGFIGDIVGGAVDIVGDVVGGVGDVVGDAVDVVKDAGSWVDDKVNEEIPGGWYTVAAATGAYYAPEIAAAMGTEAGAAGAATAAETAGAAEAASAAGSGFGLNPASTGGFGLGTSTAGTGINTGALGGMEWLGGAGTLAEGTAGLTAGQIANAGMAGSIGSNASSGLGYLGGASSLPTGTAGITGVTSTPILDGITDTAKKTADLLSGGQPQSGNTAYLLAKGLSGGQESSPIGYNMNQSPFTFTAQQPIQGAYNQQTSPLNISDQTKNLANLLRNI
jgi:hypothetical protein